MIFSQAGKKDAIPGKADRYNNDEESFIGNCLIESSTAVLIYGKWPIFFTDESNHHSYNNHCHHLDLLFEEGFHEK